MDLRRFTFLLLFLVGRSVLLMGYLYKIVFHHDTGCALPSDDTAVGADAKSCPTACNDCRGLYLDHPMVVGLRHPGNL